MRCSPPRRLDYDPAWSPKGDWIAFTSERNGSADLYRVHPDGNGLERLTDNPAYDDQAAFSPDEKQIVFVSTRAAGFANLWILDLATRQAARADHGPGRRLPSRLVAGRPVDRLFLRPRQRPARRQRTLGKAAHCRHLSVHPDGSGLKRLTAKDGNFCGSPKWSADSKSLIAYCMKGQDTWENRVGNDPTEDSCERIDVATGAAKPLAAGPGLKEAPFPLAGGDIGYLRRDGADQGVSTPAASAGPAARISACRPGRRMANSVVYGRFSTERQSEPVRLWSRNPKFELYTTDCCLPSISSTGRIATMRFDGNSTDLRGRSTTDKPARSILERPDLILAPQWSADGKQIVAGVGRFTGFPGFHRGQQEAVRSGQWRRAGRHPRMTTAAAIELLTSGANNNAFPSFAPDGKQHRLSHARPRRSGPADHERWPIIRSPS